MNAELVPTQTENPLSERERDVAEVLATGATNAEIARELHISPHTVKVHIRNIFEKLEVGSRTEASMVLIRHGWVTVPGVTPLEPETPALPDPAPLADLDPQPRPWQLAYLLVAMAVIVAMVWAPNWISRPQERPDLLSDRATTSLGQPAVTLGPRWEARTPLSQARSRMAVVLNHDSLYAIGGESQDGVLATVTAYDLRFNDWESLNSLPEPRANAAATVFGNAIYVGGGSREDSTVGNNFWRYDIEEKVWDELAALPAKLAGAAMVVFDESLYLMGGWDGDQMRDDIWRISLDKKSGRPRGDWETVDNLESPRAFFGATIIGDDLYVVGGYDGQQELSDATRYNLLKGTKERLSPLRTPRGGLGLVYDGVALNALGGGWSYPIANHERLDPTSNTWSNFPSPIEGEWRHLGVVNKEGRLHILGGWSGGYLDSHLQYQSSFRTLLPVISN